MKTPATRTSRRPSLGALVSSLVVATASLPTLAAQPGAPVHKPILSADNPCEGGKKCKDDGNPCSPKKCKKPKNPCSGK